MVQNKVGNLNNKKFDGKDDFKTSSGYKKHNFEMTFILLQNE